MPISERILLFVTAAITVIAALFCVIGLATTSWAGSCGLFNAPSGCRSTSSGALAIISFLLLMAAVIILLLLAVKILPASIRAVCLIVLFVAGIFTLSTITAYFHSSTGYSYRLVVVAHFLCYVASIAAAFWLGASYTTHVQQSN